MKLIKSVDQTKSELLEVKDLIIIKEPEVIQGI